MGIDNLLMALRGPGLGESSVAASDSTSRPGDLENFRTEEGLSLMLRARLWFPPLWSIIPENVKFLLTLSGVVAKLGRDFVGVALGKYSGVSSLSKSPGAGDGCKLVEKAGEYIVCEPFLALESKAGDSVDLSPRRRCRAGLGDQIDLVRDAERVR